MPKYSTKFNPAMQAEFPFLKLVGGSESEVFCSLCSSKFSIANSGRNQIEKHNKTKKHIKGAKNVRALGFLATNPSTVPNRAPAELSKSIESAICQVFLHAGIPFEFADSGQWKQMVKLLNPSYAANMPNSRDLERRYGGGNCLVCQSSLTGNRKSLRSLIGEKELRLHEVLESWTGKDFNEQEKDRLAVCNRCFSNVEKFYDYQKCSKEIQSKIVTSFSENQCEQVLIKQEPEFDCDHYDYFNSPSKTAAEAWTNQPAAEPMGDSEDEANETGQFECDTCGTKLYDRNLLIEHMKSHATDNKKIRCETCKKRFFSKARFEFHQLTDHEKQTKPFECPICFKTDLWSDIADFRRHFIHHKEKPILCSICGVSLKKRSLRFHMRMHEDIRPYPCEYPECAKSFRTFNQRTTHHRVHTGEKIFSCPHCPDKRFAQNYGRDLHVKKHHSQNAEELSCQICDAKFNAKFNLKSHMVKTHQVVLKDA